MIRPRRMIQAELYISGSRAKAYFHLLREQLETIHRELGCVLDWEELPAGTDSRVARYLKDVDPEDESDWPRQHEWLADSLNAMHKVFFQRVRDLDAGDWSLENENL